MNHKHKRSGCSAEHFRNPDRPDSYFGKSRGRQDPAIKRAKVRLRTAEYRNRLDERCAPSTNQIGMSLIVALVPSDLSSITTNDRDIIGRALVDLRERGFSIKETKDALRRFRRRVVDRDEDASNDLTVRP
jgi:hypothetical protein